MAKLGDFNTPTNSKGNVFDIMDWLSAILGAFFLLMTFGIGQKVYNKVDETIEQVDGGIDPIVRQKQTVTKSGPSKIRV